MYLTHKDLTRYWVLDIEANGLTPDTVWCVCVTNAGTNERLAFYGPGTLPRTKEWIDHLPKDCFLVGHNIISYDWLWLNRLGHISFPLDHLVDTLVLSKLYDPKMLDGHSLAAWGVRLGFPKVEHNEWDKFSPEMLLRCVGDVELTLRIFLALTKRMRERGFSEKSCWIEHNIREVIDRQQRRGFWFNIGGARELLAELRTREADLDVPLQRLFPPKRFLAQSGPIRVKQDGTLFASHLKLREKFEVVEFDDTYEAYDYKPFNVGSPKQRVERLLDLGWVPSKFTEPSESHPKGQPKADEESILEFVGDLEGQGSDGVEAVRGMANWLVANGRGNMVTTWLANVNYGDSRMHGRVDTCGAGSRRMTHSGPNTANIPTSDPKVQYGARCRALWGCTPNAGRKLVGYDAKSLEMLVFAHHLRAPDWLIDYYLNGNPHTNNGLAYGVTKPKAKKDFYAMIYGAQDAKLGSHHGKGRAFGKKVRQTLYEKTPGLEGAMEEARDEYESNGGFIRNIDGGFVRCPSPHCALNYKIQPDGAILMKLTAIRLDEKLSKEGLDSWKVGDIHDEAQLDTVEGDTAKCGELACQTITECGEELGFRVPMAGDYKVGDTWSETH